ncbi:MAG: tandem-95 repeat protein [Xanthobacteraceae bacterium]|nr:tandem-95 repeat protein [Xanthobacteraceae bacterium]
MLTVTDSDGDSDTASVEIGGKIVFEDDGPTLLAYLKLLGDVLHDETPGNQGGFLQPDDDTNPTSAILSVFASVNGGDDPDVAGTGPIGYARSGSLVGILVADFGADGPGGANNGLQYTFTIGEGGYSGLQTTEGQDIYLFDGGNNVIVGRYDADNNGIDANDPAAFAIHVDPNTGELWVVQYMSLHHPNTSSHDETISMADGAISVTVTLTDGDGDTVSQNVDISGRVRFDDDGPKVDITAIANKPNIAALNLDETSGTDRYNGAEAQDSNGGSDDTGNGFPIVPTTNYAGAVAIGSLSTNIAGGLNALFGTSINYGADGPAGQGSEVDALTLTLSGNVKTNLVVTALDGTPLETMSIQQRQISLVVESPTSIIGVINGGPGTSNDYIAFRISIVNPGDPANAQFKVEQFLAIDHDATGNNGAGTQSGAENPSLFDESKILSMVGNGVLRLVLTTTVTDGDGDTATDSASVIIANSDGSFVQFDDDGPVIGQGNRDWTLDEDVLVPASPEPAGNDALDVPSDVNDYTTITLNGTNLGIDWGSDGLKSLTFNGSAPTVTDGNGNPLAGLSSGGVALAYTLTNNPDGGQTLTATKGVGGETVFTITLDPDYSANGAFTFTLSNELDHPNGQGQNTLNLTFPFTAKDGDNDAASSNIVIRVTDDVPYILSNNYAANSDFEGGNWGAVQWWGQLATSLTNWTISSSPVEGASQLQVERTPNGYLGMVNPFGDYMIDMAASPGNIQISQQVSGLTPGEPYAISFVAGAPFPETAKLEVWFGGNLVGVIEPTGQMTPYSFIVTASGVPANDILMFREVGTGNDPLPSPNVNEGYHGTYLGSVKVLLVNYVDEDGLPNGIGDSATGDNVIPNVDGDNNEATTIGNLNIAWGSDNSDIADAGGMQDGALAASLTGRAVYFSNAIVTVGGVALTGGIPVLTSHGDTVSFVLSENGTKLTGVADDGTGPRDVFVVTLSDDGTGQYKFVLLDQLDHAPGASENDITLVFNFTARDFDGDTATGSFVIGVDDDLPVASFGVVEGANVTVDESLGANAGENEVGSLGSVTVDSTVLFSNVIDFGADGPGAGGGVAYVLAIAGGDGSASGLVDTATGQNIVFFDNNGVIEGHVGTTGGALSFTISVAADGDITLTQYRAIYHSNPNDPDESTSPATFNAEALTLTQTVTDYDGDPAQNTINISSIFRFEDDGPSISAVDAKECGQVQTFVSSGSGGGNVAGLALDGEGDRDLLITAVGTNNNSVNGDDDDLGAGDQWLDPTELLRLDFVKTAQSFGSGPGSTYSNGAHYGVDSASFTIAQIQGNPNNTATVFVQVFNANDDQNYGNDGSPLAITAGDISVANDASYTLSAVYSGGTVIGYVISGLDDGARVTVNTADEFNRLNIENYGGVSFSSTADGTQTSIAGSNFSIGDVSSTLCLPVTLRVTHDESAGFTPQSGPNPENDVDPSSAPLALAAAVTGAGLTALGYAVSGSSVTSLFSANYGSDGPGSPAIQYSLTTAGSAAFTGQDSGLNTTVGGYDIRLYTDGTNPAIVWGVADNGSGANGPKVFALYLDPATGQLWVSQFAAIAHDSGGASAAAHDDVASIFAGLVNVTAVVTDGDGDTAFAVSNAALEINFQDDGPVAGYAERLTLQEDRDTSGVFVTKSIDGVMTFVAGTDGAKITALSYDFKSGGTFTISDGDAPTFTTYPLTSNGDPMTVIQQAGANGPMLVGKLGDGTIIFTVEVTDPVTGAYTFTLLGPIDHPDINESGAADLLRMKISYTVTDGDGDTATGSVQLDVRDDAPTGSFALNPYFAPVVVDESLGQNASENETGSLGSVTVASNLLFSTTVDFGGDGPGSLVFALIVSNANSGLADTLSGQNIVLVQNGAVIEGRTATGNDLSFTISVDANGDVTLTQYRAVVHNDPLDHDEAGASAAVLSSGAIALTLTITDADLDSSSNTIDISSIFRFEDDGPTLSLSPANNLLNGLFFDGFTPNGNAWAAGSGTAAGTAGGWAITGDGPGTVELQRVGDGYLGMHSSTHGFMVDMDASPGNVAISQTVAGLQAGQHYTLTFEAGSPDPASAGLEVWFGGQLVLSIPVPSGVGNLTPYALDIVGGSGNGTNLLEFREIGVTENNHGTYLANVYVNDFIIVDETPGADADADDNPALAGVFASYAMAINPGIDPDMEPQFAAGTGSVVQVNVNFGSDGPNTSVASLVYSLNVTNAVSGLQTTDEKPIQLFEIGDQIVVGRYDSNGDTVIDNSDNAAFAFYLDPNTGVLTVAQFVSLKHPITGASYDEGIFLNNGTLEVRVVATDGDLDTATQTADISGKVRFEDDGPSIVLAQVVGGVSVDETPGIDAGSDDNAATAAVFAPFAAINPGTDPDMPAQFASGSQSVLNLVATFGADGAAANGSVAYSLNIGSVVSGLQTTEGKSITLIALNSNLIVGRYDSDNDSDIDANDKAAFAIYIDSATGVISVAQYVSLYHPDSADHDESIILGLNADTLSVTVVVTDGDGDTASATRDITGTIKFEDDGPRIISITVNSYGPELIVNGSFETGHGLGANDWEIFSSLNPGWTQGPDGIPFEVQTNGVGGLSPHSGNAYVELDGDTQGNPDNALPAATPGPGTNATVQQTVTGLVAGQQYELTFWYSPRGGDGVGNSGMDVSFGGTTVYSIPSDANLPVGWVQHTVVFTATSTSAVLAFTGTGTANEWGAFLDDVSLKAVISTLDDEDTTLSPAVEIQGGPGDDGAGVVSIGKINFDAGADGLQSIAASAMAGLSGIYVNAAGIGIAYAVNQVWVPGVDASGNFAGYEKGGTLVGTMSTPDGAKTAFTLEIDSSGNYKFTLVAPLNHPVVSTEDNLNLNFTVTVTDGDFDTATGTISLNVDDDSPDASSTPASGSVNEAGIAGGSIVTTTLTSAFDGFNGDVPNLGNITLNVGSEIAFFVPGTSALQGPNSSTGSAMIVFTANPGTTFTVDSMAIGLFGANSGPQQVVLKGYDADGNVYTYAFNTAAVPFAAATPSTVFDATGTPLDGIALTKLELVPPSGLAGRIIVDDFVGSQSVQQPIVPVEATVDLANVAIFGADGEHAGGGFTLQSFTAQQFGTVTSDGAQVFIKSDGNVLTGYTGTDKVVFTLQVVNGDAVFKLYHALDHAPNSDTLPLQFGDFIHATDGDGDYITLPANAVVINVGDDLPKIVGGDRDWSIDEDVQANGNDIYDSPPDSNDWTSITNKALGIVWGEDGPGHIIVLSTPGALTSGGVAIVYDVVASGNGETLNAYKGSIAPANLVFSLTLNPDAGTGGTFDFTLSGVLDHPAGNGQNVIDLVFGFTPTDGDTDPVNSTVTIRVKDDVPFAFNDTVGAFEDTPVVINVLTNDHFGADGAASANGGVTGYTQAANGSVTLNSDGTFTYSPNGNFNGPDSFTYTIVDKDGDPSTATVTLNVAPVNDPPVANPDTGYAVEQGVAAPASPFFGLANSAVAGTPAASGNLLSNDSDPDGAVVPGVTHTVVTAGIFTGTYGSVTILANGSWSYTLDNTDADTQALFQGQPVTEIFNYTMQDGAGEQSSATLTIAITGTNDAPVIGVVNSVTTLTFDEFDVSGPGDEPLSYLNANYGDLEWTQVGVYAPSAPFTGYAPHSGSNLAFIGEKNGSSVAGYDGASGSPVVIERSYDFNPLGIWMSTPSGTVTVTFSAYDNGVFVGSISQSITGGSATFVDLSSLGTINRLEIDSAPGTSGEYFGFDDFSYTLQGGFTSGLAATPATILPDITISDVDSSTLNGAQVVLTDAQSGDNLTCGTLPGGVSASLTSGAGTLTVTFLGSATLAQYEALLESVKFSNPLTVLDISDRHFTFQVIDDNNAVSNVANAELSVVLGTQPLVVTGFTATVEEEHLNPSLGIVAGETITAVGNEDAAFSPNDLDTPSDFDLTTHQATGSFASLVVSGLDGTPSFGFASGINGTQATFGGSPMTSGGAPVLLVVVGNTLYGYVEIAGSGFDVAQDRAVFALEVNPASGAFTFSLLDRVDHHPVNAADNAEGTKQLDLSGLVTITDSAEPETVAFPNVGINIIDDVPVNESLTTGLSLDEDDLVDGTDLVKEPLTANGALDIRLGADGGSITLSASGATWTANTQTLAANDGSWKLVLNGDGTYTFTLLDNTLAHGPGDNGKNTLNINVSFSAVDGDGDALSGNFDIRIVDDVPVVTALNVAAPNITLDESIGVHPGDANADLDDNPGSPFGRATVTGSSIAGLFSSAAGADGLFASTFALVLKNSAGTVIADNSPTGAVTNLSATGGGVIVLYHEGGGIVGHVNNASGAVALRVSINSTTGEVTVEQYLPIQHILGGLARDDSATLDLTGSGGIFVNYAVTDGDGDKANATSNQPLTIKIEDDGPSVAATGVVPTLTVDESFLGTDATVSFASSFVSSFGTDGAGTLVYTLGISSSGAASGLVDTATGQNVVLTVVGNQVFGKTAIGGDTVFVISVDASGNVTLDQQRAIVHPTTNPDESESLSASNLVTLTATITDGDGDISVATLAIGNAFVFKDDGVDARNDTDSFGSGGTGTTISGNVITGADTNEGTGGAGADVIGADGGGKLTAILSNNIGGGAAGIPVGGTNIGGQFGGLHINPDGSYVYTRTSASAGTDTFTYTLVDADGDTDTATLTINLLAANGLPTVNSVSIVADEDNLLAASGAHFDGNNNTTSIGDDAQSGLTGSLGSYGTDGRGVTGGVSFSVTNGQNVTDSGGNLVKTDGVTLKYFWDGATNTLYASTTTTNATTAANTASFKIVVNQSSLDYTFTLLNHVDHATGNNENDINLNVGYAINDANNDTTPGTVAIKIDDDMPVNVSPDEALAIAGVKPTISAVLVIDLSLSMDSSSGVPGLTRLELLQQAVNNLLSNSNVEFKDIAIFTFGTAGATAFQLRTTNAGAAITEINSYDSGDLSAGTSYNAAVTTVMNYFNNPGNPALADAMQQYLYFLTDGDPQSGGSVSNTATWQNFLNSEGFDRVFSIGFSGLTNDDFLEQIVRPGDEDVAQFVQDSSELVSTLQGSLPGNPSGSIFDDGGSFGADGGHVSEITYNGVTYTQAASGNQVVINDGFGGKLIFNFADNGLNKAGDWDYLAPDTASAAHLLHFDYVMVDGDGDAVAGALNIDLKPAPTIDVLNTQATEGDGYIVFTVQLSHETLNAVPVTFTLMNGTAIGGGDDFGPNIEWSLTGNAGDWHSGAFSFAPGETQVFVRTAVIDDALQENDETLQLKAEATTGTSNLNDLDTGTIHDNGDVNASPVLALNAAGNYRDEFGAASYSNSEGTLDWSGQSWTESGDNNNVATGEIFVAGGVLTFNQDIDGGETLTRSVNLRGASTATVTFDYTEGMDSGENIIVEAWNGSTWQQIGSTISGSAADGSGLFSATLTPAQIGEFSQIRLRADGNWESPDIFTVDNFNIAITTPNATNYTTTYTEGGTGVAIAGGSSLITDTDNANMESATIKLINAKAGDFLKLGALGGLTGSVSYNWVAGEITVTLTGSASKAVYQNAIEAITYGNNGAAPDTTARTIQVTVNDGISNSNTATTTVSVTAVDTAPAIHVPSEINYVSGSTPATALNAITVFDADTTGSVSVNFATSDSGARFFATTGSGVTVTGNNTTSLTLTGTLIAINAFIAANGLTYDMDDDNADTITVTSGSASASFTVDNVSTTTSSVDYPGSHVFNVHETALNFGGSTDIVVTAWNHLNSTQTTYNGGDNGGDRVTVVMTADQLNEVMSDATLRSNLIGYFDDNNVDNETLNLDNSSWNASVTGFQGPASLALAAPTTASGDISLSTWVTDGVLPALDSDQTGDGNANLLVATASGQTVQGNGGNDILVAFHTGTGNTLDGGNGNDLLLGGDGADTLNGGAGNDVLAGGKGADTFSFNEHGASVSDVIVDYNFGEGDMIHLDTLLADAFGHDPSRIRLQESGTDVVLQIDSTGGGGWSDVATLSGYASAGPDPVKVLYDNHSHTITT